MSSDTTIKTDSSKASIGSFPKTPALQSSNSIDDPILRQNIEMGKSFIRKGELDNAETAFQRACATLNSKYRAQEPNGYSLEVDVQLACITLYRGKYEEAHHKFVLLLDSPIPEEHIQNEYSAVIHRWIGVALLHQGKYELAVETFRLLLTRFAEYLSDEVQIRRDLALASAHLGNFDEAFRELKVAFDCLKILEQRHAYKRDASKGGTNSQKQATSTQSIQPTTGSHAINTSYTEEVSSNDFFSGNPNRFRAEGPKRWTILYASEDRVGMGFIRQGSRVL
jgi:tetratricopeptide (TPR) repeat protein